MPSSYTTEQLRYTINHVFLPPKLPQETDQSGETDHTIAAILVDSARAYQRAGLTGQEVIHWANFLKLLKEYRDVHKTDFLQVGPVKKALKGLSVHESIAFFIRAQNAGVIFRKTDDNIVAELFEVAPPAHEVLAATGKLVRSFPGPAVQAPSDPFENPAQHFNAELANFLVEMNNDLYGEEDRERRTSLNVRDRGDETTDPKYITSLLTGILRGMSGEAADVKRINKRFGDEIYGGGRVPAWRRSSAYLVLRVAMQTTLMQKDPSHRLYKSFMVFFHADIIELALKNNFNSDLLFALRAKTGRRLAKLAKTGDVPAFVTQRVDVACQKVQTELERRWSRIQEQTLTPPSVLENEWDPENLAVEIAANMQLPNSEARINLALDPNAAPPAALTSFEPTQESRLRDLATFLHVTPNLFKEAFTREPFVALADFEILVGRGLMNDWVETKIASPQRVAKEQAIRHLWVYLTTYHKYALARYKDNAEELSLMILTGLEIWVGIDKLSCSVMPLLREYPPEIPVEDTGTGLLKRLLLRKAVDLERAKKVALHLRQRKRNAVHDISVFSDVMDAFAFPVGYYDSSDEMKELREDIEEQATAAREAAVTELREQTRRRSELFARAASLEHKHNDDTELYEWKGRGKRRRFEHVGWDCAKCRVMNELNSLRVETHEWPLPQEEEEIKRVVFELKVPKSFAMWRAATVLILWDMATPEAKRQDFDGQRPQVTLTSCEALEDFCAPGDDEFNIVTLASKRPPARSVPGMTSVTLPATQDQVCLASGMRWQGYDPRGCKWINQPALGGNLFKEANTKRFGTLHLPSDRSSPYVKANLGYALSGVTHTSNQVLANQQDCPPEMSIHEYIAYGTMRSGGNIQWMNLLREMRGTGTGLAWGREEVGTLVSMLIWQLGNISKNSLAWHLDLEELEFGEALLREATGMLRRVAGNWKEVVTVRTVILVVSRLLSASPHEEVVDGCVMLLREARGITWEWLKQLQEKLQDVEEEFIRAFQERVCEMAAVCRSTYDVDDVGPAGVGDGQLPNLLSTSEDVAILVSCGIIVHDNSPNDLEAVKSSVPLDFKRLLRRDQRLAHAVEPTLRTMVQTEIGQQGLHQAIQTIWSGYNPGSFGWEANGRWVSTTIGGGAQIQQVHLDLLLGKLLVNGKQLGRLPGEIVQSELYMRIFGDKKVLDVIPAQLRGMEFATRSLLHGCQILFGIRGEEKEVVIRAIRDEQILEIIPHHYFQGDLPVGLVENHTHWLDLSNGEIEIRPLRSLWESSSAHWVIQFLQTPRVCVNTTHALIDINSRSFEMVAATLQPFEHPNFLLMSCSRDFDPFTLLVELPRYRLAFFRNSSQNLESRNFPGMVIDHADQSVGALVGLHNRLVLRPNDPNLVGVRRKVLVPYGTITVSDYLDDHISVTIDTGKVDVVRFADYTIDSDQGCLMGTTSLRSRLYLVYLLALTSHCLPDPLTNHTGTEEALSEFYGAACMSFRELQEDDIDLLVQIGKLTPPRFGAPQFAPRHQSVTWNSLPPLSQHHGFASRAKEILSFAKHQQVFHDSRSESLEGQEKKELLPRRNDHLDARAAARMAIYYPADIKGRPDKGVQDKIYSARDCSLVRESLIAAVASTVSVGGTSSLLPRAATLPELFSTQWRRLRVPSDTFKMSYGRHWLDLSMADSWLSIYTQCTDGREKDRKRCQLLFSLAAMVFSQASYACYVHPIVLVLSEAAFRNLRPPDAVGSLFDLTRGSSPSREQIHSYVKGSAAAVEETPSWNIARQEEESDHDYKHRRQQHHQARLDQYASRLRDYFSVRWQPWINGDRAIHFPANVEAVYFNHTRLSGVIDDYFRICNQNRLLLQHARSASVFLDDGIDTAIELDIENYSFEHSNVPVMTVATKVTISSLLEREHPVMPQRDMELWGNADGFRDTDATTETERLKGLLRPMLRSTYALRKKYAQDLQESIRNIDAISSPPTAPSIPFTEEKLLAQRQLSFEQLESSLQCIVDALSPSTPFDEAIATTGAWPRLTLRQLLRQLAYPANTRLTNHWKETILSLARDVLEYQRATRLLSYAQQKKKEDFFRELDTHVFDMESALQHPDWVLIQIEANFLARPLQVRVAQEMIRPSSSENSVLQLNMGEGKSSVIVPLVAAALADGSKLVRVVILKPLAGQMFQLLVERLSGLANRRIFYMPFSRQIRIGPEQVALIQQSYDSCMREGGVWIVQPEHILSFKLMGIDRSLVSDTPEESTVAEALTESQRWLDGNSRDILDESDEILHIRYQLVYTVGQQQPLEMHPDRWTVMEELYTFVSRHIGAVKEANRNGVDLQSGPSGCFSPVRIMDAKAGRDLVEKVVEEIFSDRLSSFGVARLPHNIKELARRFVTLPKIEEEFVGQLRQYYEGDGNDWKHLLLLRGLIAHGILVYSLKERQFRVDYGLDLSRALLAVPYRAKDVPSIRAEFGHPDVAVALTCLTYYYQGLDDAQLRLCFDMLFKLDNPPVQYEAWVDGDASVPYHLRTLNGVNTEDGDQHKNLIFPLFSKRKTVIDFYLSQVVFPKAAKEFPHKLSTSGWDLAESKPGHLTTGFSGTNDNRFLLPTSISQQDPLQQNGTNAKVLTYLLQRENNHYHCAALSDGGRLPVVEFLQYMTRVTSDQPVQVLLDVGAQMLDLRNGELAKEWLKLRDDMAATIFFNDQDEMTVVTRDGTEEPLISSPFKGQLDRCLVYLDDAHTRGTDLKLPISSRAAVTLGPNVTKDRLIQGCMRMRKLGFGQSVIFFAPSEVDRAIRNGRPARNTGAVRGAVPFNYPVHTEDILRWAIFETCKDIMKHLPHWAEQGWDYKRRREAWDSFSQETIAARAASENETITPNTDVLNSVWVRDEARSLERMYGVRTSTDVGGADADMREAIFAIPELKERLVALGVKETDDSGVDEEQEREVSHEIEQETEIERPPRAAPAKHFLHSLVKRFVETGMLPDNGQGEEFRKAFVRMFISLYRSVPELPLDQRVWSNNLFVTTDFVLTISPKDDHERTRAEFLRPVNWLLTSRSDPSILVAVSPFEANQLLPVIRKSKKVVLHVYAPRVTKDMLPLDDLKFYTVPQLPAEWSPPSVERISQLNIYASQLYFDSHDVYLQLCRFLGLHSGGFQPMETDSEPSPVQKDGFVPPGPYRHSLGLEECRFTHSPVPFLHKLIGLRRKGTGYLPTHMGKLVHGRTLSPEDFGRPHNQ
ncbi:hypothetical protein V5O48_008024 [Marasmius crinis-equi]|uniref:ubiquitinyl hydrolase 1 n=1 Tax=Marasmius crinis-equi TaxID=585013 RepID=A0ABR3FF68_9AGAR